MKMENLPECLKMQDSHLSTCLNSIKEEIENLWDSPLLQHYTKHGPDHSQRIFEVLGYLLEGYPNILNEHERFILLASAYLHDIGMQSPHHTGLPRKPEYTINEIEKIRENHHEASARMIIESISRKSGLSFGLERCKDYAGFIAIVSRYHRKLDINEVTDTSLAGEKVRLRFLAALLRFGDALDVDYRRVNMDILKLREIPVESKYHWWFHHYVQSILIEKEHIKLYFRFPKRYRRDKIIGVFYYKVGKSILDALVEVYGILEKYGVRLFPGVEIKEETYVPEGELELIPHDLSEYINTYILRIKELPRDKILQMGVVWFVLWTKGEDTIPVTSSLD